ncbi:MAG: hypothetical protein AB8U48_03965, partial [Anaplasma ovis]
MELFRDTGGNANAAHTFPHEPKLVALARAICRQTRIAATSDARCPHGECCPDIFRTPSVGAVIELRTNHIPASPQGGVKLSSSAKTGKALAHRIAVANRAHAISGVLLNIGKLLCTVAALCAIFTTLANPVGIAVAGAISAVAAVAYLAVTGVSIRDLYRSCKQVIQVKEEGLVTVQSLQP